MSPVSSSPVLGESWPFTKSEDLCLCVEMFGKKCHSNIFQIHKSIGYILVTIVGGFNPTKNQHISQTRILPPSGGSFSLININNKLKHPHLTMQNANPINISADDMMILKVYH